MRCLYILVINLLLVASFAKIFSHSVCCHLILFMVCFAVQKLFSLIRSHWFIFVFIFIILGSGSSMMLLQFMSKSVLPMFSSRSFIVSGLIFRTLIHFQFIFCVVLVFYFHSFTCSFPVFPAPFIEEAIFLPLYVLSFFVID